MVYLFSIRFLCNALYLIACSFVYILFFFGITGALVIITVQGVSTPYRFLRQCSSAHSKSILTFPLALSLHNSAAILVHSVKFEINRKKIRPSHLGWTAAIPYPRPPLGLGAD